MDKIRIATVNATGKRYIVNQLDFRANKAHVWGEVVEVRQRGRATQTRHEGQKTFLLDAVTIAEGDRTPPLLRELFEQRIQGLRDQGHVISDRVSGRGNRRVTDHGTPAQVEARQHAAQRIAGGPAGAAEPFISALNPDAWAGIPARGADKPIPETRQDVLERMVERLTTTGAYLHKYSNGEFISSSLALGLTMADCQNVGVLETPGKAIHFDRALGIFWRDGGCFD